MGLRQTLFRETRLARARNAPFVREMVCAQHAEVHAGRSGALAQLVMQTATATLLFSHESLLVQITRQPMQRVSIFATSNE
jgi:hypothetical protein